MTMKIHAIFLITSLLLRLATCQSVMVEHNFSRPWVNVKGDLPYTKLSDFWTIMDRVLPANTMPPSIERRLQTSCKTLEIQDCGDPKSCWINRLPDKPLDLFAIVAPTNRAHYRCKCDQNLPLIDYFSTEVSTDQSVVRKILTKCPPKSACEKCNKEHTVTCLDMGNGKATCICDPDYMEDRNCDRKKDGCVEPHPAATLTGKQACLDDGVTNNTCYPIPQTLHYYCVCRHPHREDKRLSFPNCMSNATVCKRPLCLGFQPNPVGPRVPGPTIVLEQSSDFDHDDSSTGCNQTQCECPDGWLGPHCAEKRGEPIPGSWSPWSTCTPDCIMPNERSRYRKQDDLHAGYSRATAIGYRSKFGRCTLADSDFCVGTYRFWRRCRVTTLCSTWTNSRLSTVVNEAIGQAMIEHDKAHRTDRVEPISTAAAELTWAERHSLNFIAVAGAFILSGMAIWIMEIHHLILHWSQESL